MCAKTWRKIGKSILVILAISPFLYVGGYFVLVEAKPLWFMTGSGPWPRVAEYRVGGEAAQLLFAPIHEFDKSLRPEHWQFP